MSTLLFANRANSTLAGSISNVAVTANLSSGTGALFPNPGAGQYFIMTFADAATGLLREIVHVTARAIDTITIVRAQEGTTALAWTAGDLASNLHTAGAMQALAQSDNIPGRLIEQRRITASGAITAPAGATWAIVEGCGGGGGGGAADVTGSGEFAPASGGGSGAYGRVVIPGVLSMSATIGTGGAAGVIGISSGNGGNGTSTIYNSSTAGGTFPGGGGGSGAVAITPPAAVGGGAAGALPSESGGAVMFFAGGDAGGIGLGFAPTNGFSGAGANSPYGTGGGEGGTSSAGAAGTGYGAGGSGGLNTENQVTARDGGAGTPGVLIISFYS